MSTAFSLAPSAFLTLSPDWTGDAQAAPPEARCIMSASFNKVMLMGNLTRDPQVKQLPSNTTVVEFGLAVSRRFKTASGEDREEVAFVDCSAFGRQAETISQFCTKGKPLFIEGRLKYDVWDDKQGAGKRSKLSVVVENFQFLPTNRDARGEGAPEFRGRAEGANSPDAPPAEAPSMFAGSAAGRKGWRGSRNRDAGGDDGESRRGTRAPAEKPFTGEKQFAEADIPF
jgi:single-strand DNA-binding protein